MELTQLQFLNNYNVEDETIKGLIELLLLETQAKGRNGKAYLSNLLSALSAHYIQNYSNYRDLQDSSARSVKIGKSQIDKIEQYIKENIGSTISVDALAELVFCSKFHFLREFKKSVGETPYQFITQYRVEQSKKYLLANTQSMSDIALSLGFNDQSHFSRVFKNHEGITPSQFIKQYST